MSTVSLTLDVSDAALVLKALQLLSNQAKMYSMQVGDVSTPAAMTLVEVWHRSEALSLLVNDLVDSASA